MDLGQSTGSTIGFGHYDATHKFIFNLVIFESWLRILSLLSLWLEALYRHLLILHIFRRGQNCNGTFGSSCS